jgi:DNA-binding beta-propeller fold protein YncE/cytochrome c553
VGSCILPVFLSAGCDNAPTTVGRDIPSIEPVERGKILYQGRRCINCHGADALGGSTFPGAPRIVGRSAADLLQVVVNACEDPTVIDNCHPLKMPDLTEDQLDDLAAYLASLAGEQLEDPGPVCDDTPGNICTIAGNGVSGNQRQSGLTARQQYLYWPQNVALDPQGRVVITDWNNYTIRRIEREGCRTMTDAAGAEGLDCPIVSIVGTGALGDSCSTDAQPINATDATMNHLVGVLYDDFIPGQSNIILWGWHQWKIKYIPVDAQGRTGLIYCLFGNQRGASGDHLPAGTVGDGQNGPTRFNLPSSCVYDNSGNFYVSDQGNLRIRVIRPDGDDDNSSPEAFVRSRANNIITTFAGGLLDEFGNFRRTKPDGSDRGDGGPASQCTLDVQSGFDAIPQMRLAIDRVRNRLYVADSEAGRIRVIDLNADPPMIDTFAGGGDDVAADHVPALQARLFRPADVDVAPDGSGDVLITDTFHHCVRLVDFETREIRTVAGVCGPDSAGYSGDGAAATEARLNEPGGSVLAVDGTVYIADTLNHRVRRVNPR